MTDKAISRTPPRGSELTDVDGLDLETPTNQSPDPGEPATPPEPAPPPEPPPFEFSHPMLKGRSPEDVEKIFKLQENAVKEQGAQLTQLIQEVREIKTSSVPKAPAEPDPTAQDYFTNPVEVLRKELDRTVAPLREEIRATKREFSGPMVREKLAQELSDWKEVEPYVDMMLRQQQFPDPNDEGLLRLMYFTAKGYMTHQGISPTPGAPTSPAPPTPPAHQPTQPAYNPVPPQHRASTPPQPPPAPSAQPKVRPLTESEKRLAREYGMTAEEYVAWQEADIEEIAESEIGLSKES